VDVDWTRGLDEETPKESTSPQHHVSESPKATIVVDHDWTTGLDMDTDWTRGGSEGADERTGCGHGQDRRTGVDNTN
jgi:hypothetical protein